MSADSILSLSEFSATELDKLVSEHGDEVKVLLKDALALGFSKDFLLELVEVAGKIGLEIFVDLKTQKLLFAARAGVIVEGEQVDHFDADVVAPSLLITLLQKLLPTLLQQLLTPENVAKLVDLLFKK